MGSCRGIASHVGVDRSEDSELVKWKSSLLQKDMVWNASMGRIERYRMQE